MTNKDKELLSIIRESKNPAEAIKTAVDIIDFVTDPSKMTSEEKELLNIIRESEAPEKVAAYMFELFFNYLKTHAADQEKTAEKASGPEGSERPKTSDC